MIKFFMDSVFPAGVSVKTHKPYMKTKGFKFAGCKFFKNERGSDSLVVILFLLFLPVLVELVDFNGHISLLC